MDLSTWISKRINKLCDDHNITPNKLATLSGITQSTINSILKGESKNPRIDTVMKICIGLEIEFNDFFDDEFYKIYNYYFDK